MPTNWIRQKDHEVVAFPEIFTNGANGFNDKTRPRAISRSDYFCQRFMNHNKIFAKNSDYLFVSQQFSERHLLENNISVSGQKGKTESGPDGTKILQCNNEFDVFKKILEQQVIGKISEMKLLQGWNNWDLFIGFLLSVQLR